jgi:hypothetical protein
MVEIVPPEKTPAHRVVESALETLLADNASLPLRVLIDDGDRSWRRHAAALAVEIRRGSVLVTASDASLVDALSFEIGGAARLPLSTPSMEAACESAASREVGEVIPWATQGVMDAVLGDSSEILVAGWMSQAFWQRQMGPIRPARCLVEIAERLGVVPVILPGPILVIVGRDRAEVEAAAAGAGSGPGSIPFPAPPSVVGLSTSDFPADSGIRIDRVLAAVSAAWDEAGQPAEFSNPVLEIPSGRRVGRWSLTRGTGDEEGSLQAAPLQPHRDRSLWEVVSCDGSREVIAESISLDWDGVAGQTLIRAPGFVGAALRHGSPAGLLIEGLARHPVRAGRPIWVPSVDAEGVRLLLGLGGPFWVDGPGVPG